MERIITLKGGQKYFAVDRGEKATFSLIPFKKAISDVAEAFEILYHLKKVKPRETNERFWDWVFTRLREKYDSTLPAVFEYYLESPQARALIAESEGTDDLIAEIDQIVEASGFGEEAIS